jgi:hypothetical protein
MTAARPLRRPAARIAGALLATVAAVAALVRLTGLTSAARELLAFDFARPPATAAEAAATAAGNLRLAGAVLLAALVVELRPSVRPALDAVVATLAALNTGAAGLALAAYGRRLIEAVAAHAGLELAAFATAGGAYLSARRGALRLGSLAAAAAACAALLSAAAVVETYVRIGGDS